MEGLTSQCASQSVGPANQLFGLLIQTILAAQCTISPPELWPKDYGPTAVEKGLEEYDFIVVGAGSAGSVVASRLSENKNWKVLLLEAGGDPPIESEIPNLSFAIQNTTFDWNYIIEKNYKPYKGLRTISKWPHGKILGGSSATDFSLLYLRGYPHDFNEWMKMGPNPTWEWSNVIEYFQKMENYQDDDDDDDYDDNDIPKKIDDNGSIKINKFQNNNYKQFVKDIFFIATINELGYKVFNDDVLVDIQHQQFIGYKNVCGRLINNKRCSSAKGYLNIAKERPNLTIIKNAHVLKINFNQINGSTQPTAVTVDFKINEHIINVKIKKELILSAGAIGTPHLLQLSGIGPEKQLKKFNTIVVKNLQVGKNLQNHIYIPLILKFKINLDATATGKNIESFDLLKLSTTFGIIDFINNFNINNSTSTSTTTTTTTNTVDDNNNNNIPNIQNQYIFFNRNEILLEYFLKTLGYTDENLIEQIRMENKENHLIFIMLKLLKPKSFGKILLKSLNPHELPLIQLNALDNKEDLQLLINGILLNEKIFQTNTFKENSIEQIQLNLTECVQYKQNQQQPIKFSNNKNEKRYKNNNRKNVQNNNSTINNIDKYLECYVRMMGTSFNEFIGTAKMGPHTDYTSVVDWNLKVHGINGLRIADASIMPTIPSGNINIISNMIGEKIIDFINDDWLNFENDENDDENDDENNNQHHQEL